MVDDKAPAYTLPAVGGAETMFDVPDDPGFLPLPDQRAGVPLLLQPRLHLLDPIRDRAGLDIGQHSRIIVRRGILPGYEAAEALFPNVFAHGVLAAHGELLRLELEAGMRPPLGPLHLDIDPGPLL